MTIRLEFKPQDCWIGVFWRVAYPNPLVSRYDVWVCLVPMLPIHIWWLRKA